VRDPEDLPNAIALNSSLFNVARLVGPAIAGILIGFVSEGVVFLINGLSYAAVLLALVAIDVPRRPRQPGRAPNIWSHLAEGLHYAGHFAPIRAALLLLGAIGLLAMPYSVLLPMFAADVLHGGPHTFGFLVSSIGLGALSGALFLAGRRNVRGLGTVILWAVTALGVGLLILSQVRQEHLACLLLAITGFGVMVQIASTNTILQILVEPDKRGRVMSLYAVAFMGTMPLGSLVAGALAARIGAPTTMAISGFVALCAAGMFARALPRLRAEVLPIYRRLGIIAGPETGVLEPTPRANCSSTATTRNTAS